MKEGFFDAGTALMFADLELQEYLNGGAVGTKSVAIAHVPAKVTQVTGEKTRVFNDLDSQGTNVDDNITNSAYYMTRSTDLKNLANEISTTTTNQATAATANQGISRRQNEINERAAAFKYELLYCMQIIFITLSAIGVFAYLHSISYFSSSLFWTLVSSFSLITFLVILFKFRYSLFNRDSRYWNKMRFAYEPVPK